MVAMSRMRRADLTVVAALPHDLIHSHIIPDILSEHLHLLLVSPVAPNWHPFYALPLVSRAFRQTCQSLCIAIFGLDEDEDESVIDDILTFAQSLWVQAKLPPERSQHVLEYTYAQLMSSHSLIRVYTCAALARSFLNLDVLRYIALAEPLDELGTQYQANIGAGDVWDEVQSSPGRHGLRMPDEKMHRVFLPLTCAMKLCDLIRPERLAYIAADYLAHVVPVYSSTPVMLKYTQDLESFVAREHRVDLETWVKWTRQTLGLLEDIEVLIAQMQRMGKLVQSYGRSSLIPSEVIQATDITRVLREVVRADWRFHSGEIKARASALLNQWILTH